MNVVRNILLRNGKVKFRKKRITCTIAIEINITHVNQEVRK